MKTVSHSIPFTVAGTAQGPLSSRKYHQTPGGCYEISLVKTAQLSVPALGNQGTFKILAAKSTAFLLLLY